ncbi:MAG: alpha/beta hydrolase [Ktedonobacteraceae bacterium]
MQSNNDGQATLISTTIAGTTVLVARNLAYANISNAQMLDIYLPEGEGPFPLLVYVHGGAFRFGDKRENEAASTFGSVLAAGFALASINYRLSGEAKFPAQIQDVKTAVRWLRTQAATYRLDPRRIGAWGASAGGHLVSLLGTSGGAEALEGSDLGHAEQSSRVQAVVAWYAPINFLQMDTQLAQTGHCGPDALTHNNPNSPESELIGGPIQTHPELVQTTNPVTYIQKDMPPFLLQHGTFDCVVPPQQSQILYDALLPLLGPERVELVYLPGAAHADQAFLLPANMQRVIQFFNRHLRYKEE